jgi:hypothetical protein
MYHIELIKKGFDIYYDILNDDQYSFNFYYYKYNNPLDELIMTKIYRTPKNYVNSYVDEKTPKVPNTDIFTNISNSEYTVYNIPDKKILTKVEMDLLNEKMTWKCNTNQTMYNEYLLKYFNEGYILEFNIPNNKSKHYMVNVYKDKVSEENLLDIQIPIDSEDF